MGIKIPRVTFLYTPVGGSTANTLVYVKYFQVLKTGTDINFPPLLKMKSELVDWYMKAHAENETRENKKYTGKNNLIVGK